jgi:hypothetical protein
MSWGLADQVHSSYVKVGSYLSAGSCLQIMGLPSRRVFLSLNRKVVGGKCTAAWEAEAGYGASENELGGGGR